MRRPTLALVLVAAACSSGDARDNLVVSDSAGIRVVTSDVRTPGWGRTGIWELSGTPRIQVGNRIGNPDQQIFKARDALRTPDGRIIVANTGLGDIRMFDPEGGHLRTMSVPPTRSGEPVAPVQIHLLPGDSLLAIGDDHSLTVYDSTGTPARRARVAVPEEGEAETMAPAGMLADGSILFRIDLPDPPDATGTGRRRFRVLKYDLEGRLIGRFGDFEGQALLFADRGAWVFGPSGQIAVGDSSVWYGTAERFVLNELGPDGQTIQAFRLDKPPVHVLSADRSAYRSAAVREAGARMDTTMDHSVYADTFPAYDQVLEDREGNLWVRNYQWFDIGSGYSYSVFDPTGLFLGEVRVPSMLEIFEIGPDYVLGRMATITGREAVYVFGLIKPEPPPQS